MWPYITTCNFGLTQIDDDNNNNNNNNKLETLYSQCLFPPRSIKWVHYCKDPPLLRHGVTTLSWFCLWSHLGLSIFSWRLRIIWCEINLPGIWINFWTIQMENSLVWKFTNSKKWKIHSPKSCENEHCDGSKECTVIVFPNATVCPTIKKLIELHYSDQCALYC